MKTVALKEEGTKSGQARDRILPSRSHSDSHHGNLRTEEELKLAPDEMLADRVRAVFISEKLCG